MISTVLFTETCNRPAWSLLVRRLLIRTLLGAPLPAVFRRTVPWQAYHLCDQMIVGLAAERWLLEKVYGVESSRVSVVPLGLTETFLKAAPSSRLEEHLICTGRIAPSKNSLELAQLASEARVPILFVGKPADFKDPYWQQFARLIDGKFVKHHGHVSTEAEVATLLQRARGYVLMSRYENWCLAAHEAAACGLPLLLPDQRWARERFGSEACYFPRRGHGAKVMALREFYERCLSLPSPKVRLHSWLEVAEGLRRVYAKVLERT